MKPETVYPEEQDTQEHVHSFVRETNCRGHVEYGLIFHHYVCRCGAFTTKHWLKDSERKNTTPEPGRTAAGPGPHPEQG